MKEYFTHDYYTRNDPKIQKVLRKLGFEGAYIFWCLVEMLYENEGKLIFDECENYAFALRTQCEVIHKLISDYDLFQMSECGLYFFSNGVNKRLLIRQTKSESSRKSAESRWKKVKEVCEPDANALRIGSERNAIKEKKSKLKEKKIEDINVSFSEFWDLYDNKHDAKKCEQKWNALTNDERLQAMQHIPKYKLSTPDKKYRKHPATYLNNKSFNNEIIEINGGQDAINKKPSANSRQRGGSITDVEKEFAKW